MRSNWPIKTIAECSSTEPYSTQIGPFGKALMADQYTKSGVPILRGVNVNRGRFHDDDFVFVDTATADQLGKFESYPDDVLLVHKGTLGQIGLMPQQRKYARYIMGNSMMRVRCDKSKLLPEYLYYWLASTEGQHYIFSRVSQVGVPQIQTPLTTLRQAALPVPPLAEQRAIVRILSMLDDKIELNQRMNNTLDAIASAIFASRLGSLGVFKKGIFSQIATLSRDSVSPSDFPNEVFNHYSIPAYDGAKMPVIEQGAEIKSNKFIVHPDSVLLSKLNPRIPRIWMPKTGVERRSICSTEFLVLRPTEMSSREFIYGFCSSPEFKERFATMVTGTSGSHQRVQPGNLEQMEIKLRPSNLVGQYTETVMPLTERYANNLSENLILANLRDALLPQLVSGKLSVRAEEGS